MNTPPLRAAFALLVAVLLVLGTSLAAAAPQRLAKARPGDCVACHKAEKVLPASHILTRDMKFDDCAKCHAPKSPTSLVGKMPSAHLHQLQGVGCTQCHGAKGKPQPVKIGGCVACHGDTDKLALRTAAIKPHNPHTSPHYGTKLECTFCHHQHEKTEVFCAQCHKFDFTVP